MDGYAVVAGRRGRARVVGRVARRPPGRAAARRAGQAIAHLHGGGDPGRRRRGGAGRAGGAAERSRDRCRRPGRQARAARGRGRARRRRGAARRAARSARPSWRWRRRWGAAALACARRPRVAVLVTGDELVGPGVPLGPGQIYDSNTDALAAQVERAGAEVLEPRGGARRPRGHHARRSSGALERADVVCVSGGVSVGPHDHVKPALRALGVEERFWGVRAQAGQAHLVRHPRATRWSSACRATRCRRWSPSSCSRARRCGRSPARDPGDTRASGAARRRRSSATRTATRWCACA